MKHNLKLLILLVLTFFCLNNSDAQQNINGWYWMNGKPQTNTLNWVKIIDATHIYAVGEGGTFMKSSDGGDSWIINSQAGVTEDIFESGGTNRIYSGWFFDVNTGILAVQSNSGDGGKLRKTTDAGNTFTAINLNAGSGGITVKDIYFINSSTGYICGNNNVKAMKTTNGGTNWTILPNLPVASFDYNCVNATDENNIILGADYDRIIVRTTNAGSTWKVDTLPGSMPNMSVVDIEFKDANTGYVGCNPSYFAYTTNGGSNWTQAIFPSNQMGQYKLKAVGNTAVAIGSYTTMYYTTNLGVTWGSLNHYDASNVNQGDPFIMYGMDINGLNMAVVGSHGKIDISNDGGASWRNKNYSVGKNQFTYYDVFAEKGNGNVWASGSALGIFYSSNGGTNWVQQLSNPSGTQLRSIQMVNSSTGYCVGGNQTNGGTATLKTTNGGASWFSMSSFPTNHQFTTVKFLDVNTGWIFGGFGGFAPQITIAKTTNGGSTWTLQPNDIGYNRMISDAEFVDANTGVCVSSGTILKTTNGGTMWNSVNSPNVDGDFRQVKMFSPYNIIIGDVHGIYKTLDGGNTWSFLPLSNPVVNLFSMDWSDQYNGIVTGTLGYTAKTSDGGVTWNVRNTGSSTIRGAFMTSKDTVFAACDRNVYNALFRLYDNVPTITLNLTIGIEGFWNGNVQVSDTARCYLRSSSSPYSIIDSSKAYLDQWGFATFVFTNASSGIYYLQTGQRNSLETWSANPVSLTRGGVSLDYDFTISSSQAYGNNMTLKSGRYCDYSGDVNQNGLVDLTDVVLINNASSVFTTGYVVQDVNGDNLVDLSDLIIGLNNASVFVSKVTP
ncbi:MAG: hypothetical protein KDD00_06855 [Ignavibacteriae bacterium]|nr:hypothetical protein [Ignavibacteriota bacterium]